MLFFPKKCFFLKLLNVKIIMMKIEFLYASFLFSKLYIFFIYFFKVFHCFSMSSYKSSLGFKQNSWKLGETVVI